MSLVRPPWDLSWQPPTQRCGTTKVSNSLRPPLLYPSDSQKPAGLCNKCCMYENLGRELYWLHMTNEVYRAGRQWCECARNCAYLKRNRHLKLLPANGPLEFIARHILGLLPKATTRSQFIILTTDTYTNLTWVILSSKTTALHVASIFIDPWIVSYEIPSFLLMYRVFEEDLTQRFGPYKN